VSNPSVNDRKKTPRSRQHGGNLDEMAQRPAESIEPPHRERIGYFCPSPRKVPNADFPPGTFDKTCFLFKVSALERRRTEDSGAFFDRSDRRNVKSDRAAAYREAMNAY
jgi:hypothetical protein